MLCALASLFVLNGGDNAFVRCVSVCLSVSVCVAAGQWELNANSSKTVKATDLKFDTLVYYCVHRAVKTQWVTQ